MVRLSAQANEGGISSGSPSRLLRRVSVGLLVAMFGSLACSVDDGGPFPGGDPEATDEVAQAVTTKGDWSAYGNGQCVAGAYTFYSKRYGVSLTPTGVQTSSIGACKYLGACMIWMSSKVRPASSKWNRYAWGSVMPQTYDMVIYPPTSSNGYGHVASVDHMEGGDKNAYQKLYIMDSNFISHEKKSPYIHTFNLKPYGFYRLKSLDGCKPRCDGNAVVDKSCKSTKCSDSKAKCVSDSLGPHCVHAGCPSNGKGTLCEGAKVLSCSNGKASTKEDCSKDTSKCVKDKLGPHCVFPGCASSGADQVCNDNQVVTCKNGDVTAKSDCDKDKSKCTDDAAGPHCVFPGCPSTGKGTLCEDKKTVATCNAGKITAREDCSKTGSTCVSDDLGPHCVYPGCPSSGVATFCDDDGVIVDCQDGKVVKKDDCAKNGEVCSVTGDLHCDAPPSGDFDAADCEELGGWAFDPSMPDFPIDVDLVFDGEEGSEEGTAVTAKADVTVTDAAACGPAGTTSCARAFALPMPRSLLDGQPHDVHAYGQDASGGPNAELTNSKQTLTCATPKPAGLMRSLANPETWDNWAFSSFQDVAPMESEAARFEPDTNEVGPDVPMQPQFVRGDDGSAEIWSLDTGVRRHVKSTASLKAWRATVTTMPAAQLLALPQGADLPVRPKLFESEVGDLWLEDVPFLPEGMSGDDQGVSEGDDPPALTDGNPTPGNAGSAGGASPGGKAVDLGPAASNDGGCQLATVGSGAGGFPPASAALFLSALALGAFGRRKTRKLSLSLCPKRRARPTVDHASSSSRASASSRQTSTLARLAAPSAFARLGDHPRSSSAAFALSLNGISIVSDRQSKRSPTQLLAVVRSPSPGASFS
jgi:hypothetical protein